MDINEKHGALVFVDYSPHTDALYIRILEEPWSREKETANHGKNYTIYKDEYSHGEYIVLHDTMLDILKGML